MKRYLSLLLLAACQSPVQMPWRAGTEFQVYPAGYVVAVQARRPLGEGATAFVRAGYNFTDRRDFGEQDDEEGGGPGVGIGLRREMMPAAQGTWFWGVRLDVWDLAIDWRDGGQEGRTDVLVVQPAGELGYRTFREGGGRTEYALTLGSEVNVDTDGEDVGQGAILLLGVTYAF